MKEEKEKQHKNEEQEPSGKVSRRDFLVGAGTVVVGGAFSAGLLSGCNGGEEKTVTTTLEKTKTVTTTIGEGATATVTETTSVGGGTTVTATTTVTQPGGGALEPWQEPEQTFLKEPGPNGGMSGASLCDVKNGKIVRIRPLHYNWKYSDAEIEKCKFKIEARGKVQVPFDRELMPHFTLTYKKRVYSPNRVKYPLQRIDWEPGGDPAKINPQNRGISKYKRISWDSATDIIASEIKRVQEKYGVTAIITVGEDGHAESKSVHKCGGCHSLLLEQIGGCTIEYRNADTWEGWFWGTQHVWINGRNGRFEGDYWVTDIANNTEMIVWSGDHETVSCQIGGHGRGRTIFFFKECGIKQIWVTPDLNYTGMIQADKWIPVMPDTDTALFCAIANLWLNEGTYDQGYLDSHVVGFDAAHMPDAADPKNNVKDYILGTYDGVAKTPKWASAICHIPVWTIKALAREWAAKITTYATGPGGNFIRGPYSHEASRMVATLLAMQGAGKKGVVEWTFGSSASYAVNTSVRSVVRALRPPNPPQMIPRSWLHHAILEGSFEMYGGTRLGSSREDQFRKYVYPVEGGSEIHMMWSEKVCNTTCWNCGNKFIEAARSPKIECYIANHQWLENDCILADLVLPIATKYEVKDIASGGSQYSTLQIQEKCIEPIGESLSDYEIILEVAKKLGTYKGVNVLDGITQGKSIEDWIKKGYDDTNASAYISWEELNEKGYWCAPVDWEKTNSDHSNVLNKFYVDPVNNPLATPTGKLELYSQSLAEAFPDDNERGPHAKYVPGGPGWTHDESLSGERCKNYPLLLISNHPRWRHHAQYDDVSWYHELPTGKVRGYDGYMYEPVWINPVDAASRNIKNGDIVQLYNERGIVLGGAYITQRVMPGAISQDHGARIDMIATGPEEYIDRGGANNMISPYEGVSMNCHGMASSAFLVELAKVSGSQMEQWREKYPEAFARKYDYASGLVADAWIVEGGA